jgi:hypothetical protein
LFRFQKPNSSIDEFQNALYCVLLRHVTVCDGGFQSALQEEVFIVLKEEFDVYMECFASPLNCRYRRFCSQWVDTDKVKIFFFIHVLRLQVLYIIFLKVSEPQNRKWNVFF